MATSPATAALAESSPVAATQSGPATGKIYLLDPDTDIVIVSDPKAPLGQQPERVANRKADTEKWARFVRSIRRFGVIQPIVVRKDGEKYAVIAGRGRVEGAREANAQIKAEGGTTFVRVPAVLKRSNDTDSAFIAVLENEQRENTTPIEQALAAEKLLSMGGTDEEVADALNVSLQQLKNNVLPLLDLDDDAKKELLKGGVLRTTQTAAAQALTKLSRDEQKEAVKELKAEAEKKKAEGKKLKNKDVRKKVAEKKKAAGGDNKTKNKRAPRTASADRDARPSIKDVKKAWLGAMTAVGDDSVRTKLTPMQAVAEILGWVVGNNPSDVAELLVGAVGNGTKVAKDSK